MKYISRATTLTTLIAALFLTACTTHVSDLSMISNKNVSLDKINLDTCPQKKNVEGEDSKFVFLFIPFGQAKLREALNDALEKGNGDLMIDASVYTYHWWFIVGQVGIKIKGDVINTRKRN